MSISFASCRALTNINIPEAVTYIGTHAFYWCDNLVSITIPDKVTYIGDYIFQGCINLTSISIPKSVTSVGYYAFADCDGLDNVYYLGTSTEWLTLNASIEYNNTNLTNANRYHIYFEGDVVKVTDKSGAVVTAGESTYSVAYSTNGEGKTVATLTFHNNNDYEVVAVKE